MQTWALPEDVFTAFSSENEPLPELPPEAWLSAPSIRLRRLMQAYRFVSVQRYEETVHVAVGVRAVSYLHRPINPLPVDDDHRCRPLAIAWSDAAVLPTR